MDDATDQRSRTLHRRAALIAAAATSIAVFGTAGTAPAYADDAAPTDPPVVDASSADPTSSTEPTDPPPSDPPTETTDPGTGDPGTGTTDPGSGSGDPGTGSGDPGTGSGDPGTGAGDPGSGTGDPGTGTGDPGTGSGDPGTGTPGPTTPPPTDPPASPPPTTIPPAPDPAPRPLVLSRDLLSQRTGQSTVTAAVLQARRTLDAARATLRDAEGELAALRGQREAARATAQQMDELATDARARADEAARLYITASRGGGDALDSLDSVFGAGNDLLAGLGTMQRVSELTGDPDALRATADRLDADAEAAEARAADAWAAVDAVPVEAAQQKVDEAEAAVADAEAGLASAQSQLAASSVTAIDNLPTDSGQLSDQGWSAPVAGRITDGFGPRPNKPLAGVNDFHRGTDVAASCGSPVFAATGGTVVEAGRNGSLGNWILVDHGDGVTTGYGHLVDGGILVATGDRVEAGQLIGAVGSTGASTGCHLHYEVRLGGVAIDAVPFMAARGIQLG